MSRALGLHPCHVIELSSATGLQLDKSNVGLAAIAAILIGLHLAISALAAALYPRQGAAGGVTVAAPPG